MDTDSRPATKDRTQSDSPIARATAVQPDPNQPRFKGKLTKRQQEAFRFIEQYINREGCSPTYEEIAAGLGVTKTTVYEFVDALIKKNWLLKNENQSRSLSLVGRVLVSRDAVLAVIESSVSDESERAAVIQAVNAMGAE